MTSRPRRGPGNAVANSRHQRQQVDTARRPARRRPISLRQEHDRGNRWRRREHLAGGPGTKAGAGCMPAEEAPGPCSTPARRPAAALSGGGGRPMPSVRAAPATIVGERTPLELGRDGWLRAMQLQGGVQNAAFGDHRMEGGMSDSSILSKTRRPRHTIFLISAYWRSYKAAALSAKVRYVPNDHPLLSTPAASRPTACPHHLGAHLVARTCPPHRQPAKGANEGDWWPAWCPR